MNLFYRKIRRNSERSIVWLVCSLIKFYQAVISPTMGPKCRYIPSCSAYADEVIRNNGVWVGMWMLLARLLRCHPLGGCGFDPIPQKPEKEIKWYTPWRYGNWKMTPLSEKQEADTESQNEIKV